MIMETRIFHIKPGYMEDALALLVAERENLDPKFVIRIAKSLYGGVPNRVSWGCRFDDMAQLEQFWAEWNASTRSAPFLEKWRPILEGEGARTIWDVKSS